MTRKMMFCGFCFVLVMQCFSWPVAAEGEPPAEGGQLPAFVLTVPEDPLHRDYLGLAAGQKTFAVQDIKAEVVIIEIFSMY